MLYSFYSKSYRALLALFLAIFLAGCFAQQKSIDPYRDSVQQPSTAQRSEPQPSKSLPQVQTVQRDEVAAAGSTAAKGVQAVASGSLLPVLTLVADRIVAYEGKLQIWEDFRAEAEKVSLEDELRQKIDGCQLQLQNILDGYNRLHETLLRESSGMAADIPLMEQMHNVEGADITFLESECQQIIHGSRQTGGWIAGTQQKLLEESEKEIAAAVAVGDYQQVIALYEQLPVDENRKPSFEAVYNYAQALLRTQQEQKAGEVLQALLQRVQEQNQIGREFQLMQLIADIEFGLEEYPRAFDRYVGIINRYAGLGDHIDWARKQQAIISARNQQGTEVKSFSALMLAYLSYNPDRDGFKVLLQAEKFVESFPESTVIPTVNRILFESQDRADAWFAAMMQQLHLLRDEKKYDEALQYIEKLPRQDMPTEQRETLRNLTDELISAQFQDAETRRLTMEASLQQTWATGQNHLRAKEYDQAIEVFSTMLDTDYGERARQQIEEAANLAAQEDRRRAAELFVRASSTTDPEGRIKLLFESRQLLQDILEKYPQSDVVDKVRNNLDRIEQEIRAIDPSLLTVPATGNEPGSSGQQPVQGQGGKTMNVGELQIQPGTDTRPWNNGQSR